ncbi:MAG: CHAT domain-containing protein [Burkholderiaceae bacterium]|nr:CHAT domain-containing protein [Burkholderiaceae bacterium]
MLATVLASQTKDDEARQLFTAGMVELIALEREVATDSEGLSSKEKKYLAAYIESYLGVLARAYEKSPTLAIASEAFVLGDLARSSGVQKALNASTARANITNPRLAELARQEQDLNQQITFLTRFAKELAMQPANQQLPEVQKKIRADIDQLRQEAKATIRSIEIDFPEYAELISPKPASLERVQKNLKANEVMITWFIGQTSSYVWAIGSTGNSQFKTLKLTQADLRKDVHTLRKALDPQVTTVEEIPAFNFALSHQIYKSLIDPVQSVLEGKNTLVLVPHDEIGQLPLGVLTTSNFTPNPKADLRFSNYRDAPWLIKKYALVTVPSATALTSLRSLPKPKEGRLDYIAFGDPLFNAEQAKANDKGVANLPAGNQLASRGVPLKLRSSPNTAQVSSAEVSILPRLPDTNDEIQEIAKVFNVDPKRDIYLQKRANLDEVLKANLSNRKVVMFSTHGLVPGELNGLTQPALALTNPEVLGQKGDGLLKVDQILTLKLNADWVVLSACNTAAGDGEGAEALSGLGRAFFYAGARSLLVSSWPVDSQASRKLMTDLFNRQNQDKAMSKPQALQQASLQLLSQGQPDAKDENYSYAHPLFWAPFMMVGD